MTGPPSPPRAKVITVSDGVAAGVRADTSGPALVDRLRGAGWDVVAHTVVTDGIDSVSTALRKATGDFAGLVVTTGGTGFGARDVTPEATSAVLDRLAPGLAEAMRAANPSKGPLSRGVSGTAGRCLVINVPGSRAGALESLDAVIDVLAHAVELTGGGDSPHPG